MTALRLTGARVIDPATGEDAVRDLSTRDGRFAGAGGPADEVWDGTGCLVCPGLIELHAFAPPRGSRGEYAGAAAAGGYATVGVIGGPLTETRPAADEPRMLPIARLTAPGERRLAELAGAAAGGAVAFTDDPDPSADPELLRRGLLYAAMLNRPVLERPAEPSLSIGGVAHDGPVAAELGLPVVPPAAEVLGVLRAVALAAATGGRVHLCCLSSAGSLPPLGRAKADGTAVTADAAAHQLLCTEADLWGFDPAFRTDPPLRAEADRLALIAALRDGTVDAVSSDHRTISTDAEDCDFFNAPVGVPGFETALAAAATACVRGDADWPWLIARFTVGPAAVLGLPAPSLAAGEPADFTVIRPEAAWTVRGSELAVPVPRTPLAGRTLDARVVATVRAGRVLFFDPTALGRV